MGRKGFQDHGASKSAVMLVFAAWFVCVASVLAGGGNRWTTWGPASPAQYGDYVTVTTANGGLQTPLRYYIEVPPGTYGLTIQIWDADVGAGGSGENAAGRDRNVGTWNTTATYNVYTPSGGTVTQNFTTGNSSSPSGADNNWLTVYSQSNTTLATAGHWHVRVASSGTTGTCINSFGIRAWGLSGSNGSFRDLNVYAKSVHSMGVNTSTDAAGRQHTVFPYITSGCGFTCNEFDYDDSTDTGYGRNAPNCYLTFESRIYRERGDGTGGQTTTFPWNVLSANNTWTAHSLSGFNSASAAVDYGLWRGLWSIQDSTVNAGNYTQIWLVNYLGGGPAPVGTSEQPNGFRIYYPAMTAANSGGEYNSTTAPKKPYLVQMLGYVSGANPPVNGQVTRVRVQVWMTNPTSFPITFNASRLISAYVPTVGWWTGTLSSEGGAGGSSPTWNSGTRLVQWNPGTVAANTTAKLIYELNVTPSGTTNVTGTPASNGTQATFLDETGDATTGVFTFGPLCQLSITPGTNVPTLALIGSFGVRTDGDRVIVRWETVTQNRTAAFHLLRQGADGDFEMVTEKALPALIHGSGGGVYEVADPDAVPGGTYTYKLMEIETTKQRRFYGPYTVTVGGGAPQAVQAAGLLPKTGGAGRRADVLAAAGLADSSAKAAAGRTRGRRPRAAAAVQAADSRGKIYVAESGLYRLSADRIGELLGLDAARVQKLIAGGQISLSQRGREVSWMPAGDGGAIYFYGQGFSSIYTDTNVYWIEKGKGKVMEGVANHSPTGAGADATFADTAHFEQNRVAPIALFSDPEADVWMWEYVVAGYAGYDTKAFGFSLPGLAAAAPEGSVTVRLKGATDDAASPDHTARISINGRQVGETSWDGTRPEACTFRIPAGVLKADGNELKVQALLGAGVSYSIFYVDSFDVTYQRRYEAVQGKLACRGDRNPEVTVSGLGTDAIVLDVSTPWAPVRQLDVLVNETPDGALVSFMPDAADTPYLAVSLGSAAEPESECVSGKGKIGSAKCVIVTSRELEGACQALANYRSRSGLNTAIVTVDDIYNEYTDGIETPAAIEQYIGKSGADYVVLAGVGSYDYKDYLGSGKNIVPVLMAVTPYGLFVSDSAFVKGSGAAIGRLPVRTADDVGVILRKIQTYEGAAAASDEFILVADNPDDGGPFNEDSDSLAALLAASGRRNTVTKLYFGGADRGAFRSGLLAELSQGAFLVNYLGHGGPGFWAQEQFLTAGDAGSVAGRLPIIVSGTCYTANHAMPMLECLGNAMVASSGGAIAFIGVSSPSENDQNKAMCAAVLQAAMAPGGKDARRLGDIVKAAAADAACCGKDGTTVPMWNLIGDPATLIVPPPALPAERQGTSGPKK